VGEYLHSIVKKKKKKTSDFPVEQGHLLVWYQQKGVPSASVLKKHLWKSQVPVAYTYNPNYSGGRD
jgi:hypothetical protein